MHRHLLKSYRNMMTLKQKLEWSTYPPSLYSLYICLYYSVVIATLWRKALPVSLCFQIFPKSLLTVKLKFIMILLNPNNQIFIFFFVIVKMTQFHLARSELSKSEPKQGLGLLSTKNIAMLFKACITQKWINIISCTQLCTEIYICGISLHSCPTKLRRRCGRSAPSLWILTYNTAWKDKCQFSCSFFFFPLKKIHVRPNASHSS